MFASSAQAAGGTQDVVVMLFLRGGIDGLNLVVPLDGADRVHYETARPNLAIPATGSYAALPLTTQGDVATGFGIHPSASALRDLWSAGRLAIVHACGLLTSASRSHFDAQLAIEQGLAKGLNTGWMARAIDSEAASATSTLPALAAASRPPASLAGTVRAVAMDSPADFALNTGPWSWQKTRTDSPAGLVGVNETLGQLWQGHTGLELSGARADRALRVIATQPYGPLPAGWPTTNTGKQFWTILQSIRFGLGLRYATLDLGGWDTHDAQGTAGSGFHYYQNKIAELSAALAAFQAELEASGLAGRVTTVVQSEFGRRVRENGARGTDHGYGNPVLVLGGAVNGRKFYGTWPGLAPETVATANGDVPVTTDYRRVLSEILVRRMANPQLERIFPGYAGYSPLGMMQGTDLATAVQAPAASQLLPVPGTSAPRCMQDAPLLGRTPASDWNPAPARS